MQTKLTLSYAIVLVALLTGGLATAQSEINFSDLNPQDVDVQRTDSAQQAKELPPIQPAGIPDSQSQGSIFRNDLRGSGSASPQSTSGSASDFAAQPLPPSPRYNPSGSNAGQPRSQDPMKAMNPSRLPVIPPQNRPQQPQFDTQPRTDLMADTIPATTPANPRSILTPTTPKKEDAGGIIVPAGFENENRMNSLAARNNATMTGGTVIKKDIKSLIASYSIARTQQPIPGVPKSMEEMLQTTDANARLSMVQQYWETYFDWATLQNQQRFETWLNQIRSARSQTDQQLLQTAISMAKNEILAAEIQLARSQSKLQEISRTQAGEFLPLPLNDPVTSKYITHYDWYAKRNMVPPKLKGINEMLPRTYQLLSQRAQTVGQAEQARNLAVSAYASGQTGMASVLEAGRSWRSSLQSMIATVVSYNKAISDYALTITPRQKPVADIASMLVSKPKEVSATNISDQTARTRLSDNSNVGNSKPYLPRQVRPSGGEGAVGPNAGRFRRPTATQQPSTSLSGTGLGGRQAGTSQPDASRAAMPDNRFSAQPSRVSNPYSGKAAGANSGIGNQSALPSGQEKPKSQQPTGNNQSFQGGGGSFGG